MLVAQRSSWALLFCMSMRFDLRNLCRCPGVLGVILRKTTIIIVDDLVLLLPGLLPDLQELLLLLLEDLLLPLHLPLLRQQLLLQRLLVAPLQVLYPAQSEPIELLAALNSLDKNGILLTRSLHVLGIL